MNHKLCSLGLLLMLGAGFAVAQSTDELETVRTDAERAMAQLDQQLERHCSKLVEWSGDDWDTRQARGEHTRWISYRDFMASNTAVRDAGADPDSLETS